MSLASLLVLILSGALADGIDRRCLSVADKYQATLQKRKCLPLESGESVLLDVEVNGVMLGIHAHEAFHLNYCRCPNTDTYLKTMTDRVVPLLDDIVRVDLQNLKSSRQQDAAIATTRHEQLSQQVDRLDVLYTNIKEHYVTIIDMLTILTQSNDRNSQRIQSLREMLEENHLDAEVWRSEASTVFRDGPGRDNRPKLRQIEKAVNAVRRLVK